jgi:hypothetical protein
VTILRQMLSPEGFERMVAALSPETAEAVRRPPLPLAWLPGRCVFELSEVALRAAFNGDEAQLRDMARRSMLIDLKGIYRVFIRFASAKYVIDRGARLWDTYWRNNGRVSVDELSGNAVEVKYEDLASGNHGFWIAQCGSLLGVIEATGLKNGKVAIVRGGGNERWCVVRVTWD